jgi:FtsP/CotA-like multicopper oxidase with cupredoxin domain
MRPGVPNPSVPGESFLDTPIVNGTAYPVLKVDPKAYRFRILNAGNDRFLNLQLYVAADKTAPTTADTDYTATPARLCDGSVTVAAVNCTEVKMVPVSVAPANQYADTPSGIPDPTTAGPKWIQIGTEGGFMPEPIEVPQQPIGYNLDPAYFNFGIVNQHSLFLGSAERADVIVDFSAYAGKTLILYNDSPAPVPAGAAPYDFYTGDGNLMDSGGAPNTLPGYGPNTRTIMQIQVADGTPAPYDLAALKTVFAKTSQKRGVFEVSQDAIIVPQAAYNSAYNMTFPSGASQFILDLGDQSKTFQPLGYDDATKAWSLRPAVTIPLEMKAMHDEMGGVYDTMFGRMSGMLGLTNPTSPVHVLIPYGFSSPPTDIVKGSLEFTPVGVLADGTQLWRIFHNGVDTHPIHTHLFHAQLISRVGQDGQVAPGAYPAGQAVDASDMGWKDTFKVNPLEIAFFALRPTVPAPSQLPFELPDSIRLIDPALPEGAPLPPPAPAGWFDPAGNPIPEILNHYVNFGWEYVWHCHILSHEEMDFMHSLVFAVPPEAPTGLSAVVTTSPRRVNLSWIDNSNKTVEFRLERADNPSFTGTLTTATVKATGSNPVTYRDTGVANNRSYWYRVWAIGPVVGDTGTPGFQTMSADSVSNTLPVTIGATTTATAPTNLRATGQPGPQVSLIWMDNANSETGFVVERCTGVGCDLVQTNFAEIAAPGPSRNTGDVTYVDATVTAGNTYTYRVKAMNGTTSSAYTNTQTVAVVTIPAAPTSFTVVLAVNVATLTWVGDASATNFTVQRASNAAFTRGVSSETVTGLTITRTLDPKTTYYYRIRANNAYGSSGWTNASPFPVKTP